MAPKWFQLVLERAQDAHLFVTVPRPYTPRAFPNHTLANLEHLLASGKHFAGLHGDVLFHTADIKHAVPARMAAPMPALARCTWFYYPPDQDPNPNDAIPLSLFGGNAPALRKLYLRGVLPTIHPDIRRRLTHLILLDCARPDGGWVEFLRHTPQLEALTLGLAVDAELEPPPATARLDLPRLATLTLEGDYRTAGRLLVSIQPNAQLRHLDISVTAVPRGSAGAQTLLVPLARLLPAPGWQVRDTAALLLRADTLGIKVTTHTGRTVALRARTYGVYKDPAFLSALATSLGPPLFAPCNRLTLDGLKGDVDRLTNDALITLLLPFANATTLTLKKAACSRILGFHSGSTRRFERDVPLLQGLQTMVLHCDVVRSADDVRVFLARRAAEGRPVRRVCFCFFAAEAEEDEGRREKAEEGRGALCEEFGVEVEFFDGEEALVD